MKNLLPPTDGGRWAIITEAPAYEVNEIGEVRRRETGRKLTPQLHKSGYWHVQMTVNRRPMNRMLHRLTTIAFIGPPPTPKHEAAHKDGNPHNCYWRNMKWATAQENSDDKMIHGTQAWGARSGTLKHSDEVVWKCRELSAEGLTYPQISQRTGVPVGTIFGFVHGTRRQRMIEMGPK